MDDRDTVLPLIESLPIKPVIRTRQITSRSRTALEPSRSPDRQSYRPGAGNALEGQPEGFLNQRKNLAHRLW